MTSARTFRLYSDGYAAQILSLQADIAAYPAPAASGAPTPAERKKLLKRGIIPRL